MLPVKGGLEWGVWNMETLECVLLSSVYSKLAAPRVDQSVIFIPSS